MLAAAIKLFFQVDNKFQQGGFTLDKNMREAQQLMLRFAKVAGRYGRNTVPYAAPEKICQSAHVCILHTLPSVRHGKHSAQVAIKAL